MSLLNSLLQAVVDRHSSQLTEKDLQNLEPILNELNTLTDDSFTGLPGTSKTEMLQLILDNIPARVFWKDNSSVIAGCNRLFASDFGFETPKNLVGKTDNDLPITAEDAAAFREGDQRVMKKGEPEYKLREPRTGDTGEECWVETNKIPLRSAGGEIIGLLGTYEDITESVRAEQELLRLNAELERASRQKDEFLAGMSHELRTPLNAILGISEALGEGIYGELRDEQRNALSGVEEAGRHLLSLINDILDVARIESGETALELAPVDVNALCKASLNLVQQAATKKKLEISSLCDSELSVISADARRVKQILVNLLSNAVKFTPEGGKVSLYARINRECHSVEFSVEDSGPGIPQASIDKLFQPFVQLDSGLAREHGGTGLGLALVSGLTDLHGGGITVDSVVGRGSVFTVSLPCEIELQNTTGTIRLPETISESHPQAERALIVEDSAAAAEQLSRYLHEHSISALICPRGDEAVEAALRHRPDLIFLDILLPGSSGWDVIREFKSNPDIASIPVVIVSVVDDKARGEECGADAFLMKPFSRSQLVAVLEKIRRSAQAPVSVARVQRDAVRILLAEDNEANVATTKPYLEAKGYEVIVASNGEEALALASKCDPALVLMDVQMPKMDGLQAMAEMQKDQALRDIPVIALTALAMPGDRERCLEVGALEYLSKPVSLRELNTTICEILKRELLVS